MLFVLRLFWLLPVVLIIWPFYILPLWLFKQIKFDRIENDGIIAFKLIATNNLYATLWASFSGWSAPFAYIFKQYTKQDFPTKSQTYIDEVNQQTREHERRHCFQQFSFGPFFYPFWILALLVLYLVGKNPYEDNPFERDARKSAGQE